MARRRVLLPCFLTLAAAVAGYALFRPLPRDKTLSRHSGHPGFYENTFRPVGFAAGNEELARLHRRFHEKYYSWHYEEWFIRDFFDDMRGGFFVDVGAWHYSRSSNTFLLEDALQWSGIAIDAQERFRAGYVDNRPRTKYFTYFVSDRVSGQQELFVPRANTAVASANKGHIARHQLEVTETIRVPEITLDALFDREGVKKIDFLSLDIELAEPAALRGFDIQRFAPRLVCVEDHPDVHEFIEDYFKKNGYAKIGLWSRIDSHNSYFAPHHLVDALEIRQEQRR